jgi:hypothetical protein
VFVLFWDECITGFIGGVGQYSFLFYFNENLRDNGISSSLKVCLIEVSRESVSSGLFFFGRLLQLQFHCVL